MQQRPFFFCAGISVPPFVFWEDIRPGLVANLHISCANRGWTCPVLTTGKSRNVTCIWPEDRQREPILWPVKLAGNIWLIILQAQVYFYGKRQYSLRRVVKLFSFLSFFISVFILLSHGPQWNINAVLLKVLRLNLLSQFSVKSQIASPTSVIFVLNIPSLPCRVLTLLLPNLT